MKKLFALVLALLMFCSCAAAEGINSYYFDPAAVEGVDGGFMALGEFGLQMFVPAGMMALEPSEADAARGVMAALSMEDGSLGMSVALAGVAGADGNLITDLYGLADFYAASGVTEMEIAMFNDLPALFYVLSVNGVPYGNLAMCTEDGYVLAISVLSNGSEEMMQLANLMLFSVMPYAE